MIIGYWKTNNTDYSAFIGGTKNDPEYPSPEDFVDD